MTRAAAIGLLLILTALPVTAQDVPDFRIWFDCVARDPKYPGQAIAYISYEYDGDETVYAEQANWFGDTDMGETMTLPFPVQPGEHVREIQANVGALRVQVLKIVLFGELYAVTVYDLPEMQDCPSNEQPTPEAIATWGSA